jgi:hypothetical protein
MKWLATIAVGPIPESAVDALISNLPPGSKPVFVGYGEEIRLSLVNLRVGAPSEAEASTLGLEIFNKSATSAGLSLQPEIRRVEKA